MSKKKLLLFLLSITIILFSNIYIMKYLTLENDDKEIKLSYILKSKEKDFFQIFYGQTEEWKEENSQVVEYTKTSKSQVMKYFIPKEMQTLRIDLGNKLLKKNEYREVEIENLELKYNGKTKEIDLSDSKMVIQKNNISDIEKKGNNNYIVKITGEDSFIVLNPKELKIKELISIKKNQGFETIILKIILCIITDAVILILIIRAKNIFSLLIELKNNKKLIFNLSKNDFKTKYAGSYLGITWAFVNPIITILVYWFVFEFGLKAGAPQPGVPFILWLMSGLIPWFFYSDGINSATNCMFEYSYLVKKVVFKISVLPIVKILSSLFIHFVFIGFLIIVTFYYKFYLSIYTLQIFYYLFCLFFIILATSYATSSIILFFRDLGQLINIFLQIGIWMTPIMWNYNIIPLRYQWIAKLNPMLYIVEGYRDTFIYKTWFWEKQGQTVYFWFVCMVIFIIGMIIFKKLKPHFADVL